jgi:hypothetical protein
MQGESKSLLVMMFIIGIGILLISGTTAAAAEKLDGKEFVNAKSVFSIVVPPWDGAKKEDIDYLALGCGLLKLPQIVVSRADYYTDKSTAESLAKSMINILKDRYAGTDFSITYTKEVKLADGTPAIEAGIKWNVAIASLDSSCLWAKKGETRISVIISDMTEIKEPLKLYMYSLSIK